MLVAVTPELVANELDMEDMFDVEDDVAVELVLEVL